MNLVRAERLILHGRYSEALSVLDRLLEHNPLHAEALRLSALSAIANGDPESGLQRLREAANASPLPATLLDLSHALQAYTQWTEALEVLERIASPARDIGWHRAYGGALFGAGRFSSALEHLLAVFDAEPESEQDSDRALACAWSAARPDVVLEMQRRLATLRPGDPEIQSSLATALWQTGEPEESLAVAHRVLEATPMNEHARQNWLRAVDHTTFSACESRDAWRQWGPLPPIPRPRHRFSSSVFDDPSRCLRIGYLVDEIHKLPNSHFVPPMLRAHSRDDLAVYGYLASPDDSGAWQTLSNMPLHARDARGRTPREIARLVRKDRIDILVNLSWEFRHRHLAVFACRPAPACVELPFYPATTGSSDTGFIFTDEWICPPGQESMYVEQVRRPRHGYLLWEPPPSAPDVSPLPALRHGCCTFGLFQRPAKMNQAVWDAVGRILRDSPSSRLLIHHPSAALDIPGSATRHSLEQQLSSRGVDPARITFAGVRDNSAHLALVTTCDMALDTFPYAGTTTTFDCLWMGLPVLTLACETHAGRVGHSILSRLGLDAFVAHCEEDYVKAAVRCSSDFATLSDIRQGLRQRLRSAVFMNPRLVMDGVEREYRGIWHELCSKTKKNEGAVE